MPEIILRKADLNDLSQLQKICHRTFFETFSTSNSQENMNKYLEDCLSVRKLTEEINNPDSVFYFAIFENEAIGYLKLNFGKAQTELKEQNALEIERIYVLAEFHGKKVGQILCEKAIEFARQNNSDYIWLGVWEKNYRAIRFYQKNGFYEFYKHIFRFGDDEQIDLMMKLKLK